MFGYWAAGRGGAGPGAMVTKMQLFSFYGTGAQPPAGWVFYWSRVQAWLAGGENNT